MVRGRKSRQTKTPSKPGPLTPAKSPTSDAFQVVSPSPSSVQSSLSVTTLTWHTSVSPSLNPAAFDTPKSQTDGGARKTGVNLTADIDAELASHVYHHSPNPDLALPPVEPSRQLSSSAGVGSTKRSFSEALEYPSSSEKTCREGSPLQESHQSTAASMAGEDRHNMTVDGIRMGPPETPGRRMAASPQFFPSLQFSPDLFGTPLSGPAIATVLPQNRLFWDPSSNHEQTAYSDPFGHAHSDIPDPFTPSPVISHGFQSTGSVSSSHAYDLPHSQTRQGLAPSISPNLDGTGFPPGFTASPRVPAPVPEDPSLFLSSPARRFGSALQPSHMSASSARPGVGAYHHQMEEFKREEEHARQKRARRISVNKVSKKVLKRPISPVPSNRPGLKSSSTHSGAGGSNPHPHQRRQSQVSFADSVSIANPPYGGRSSPLKRSSISSYQGLDGPQSRNRTSLSFTIDKDGRAKTVVTKVPDRPASRMELDDGSTDSESDSVDATDFDVVRSQNTSFAFPNSEEQNRQIDKLRYESRTHSKSSSYSSTIGSSASAFPSSRTSSVIGGFRQQPRMSGDPRAKPIPDVMPRRGLSSSFQALPSDETVVNEGEDSGDAQHALRAILNDRSRSHSSIAAPFSSQRGTNHNHSSFHSSPPFQPMRNSNYAIFNASPTTVTDPDLTPSTDRGSQSSNRSSNSTRCICESLSPNGKLMIQCECCSNWLHAPCVGITSHNDVPPVYICVYCVQTPMRHGRLREPSRAAAMAPVSPLANKKGSYRGR